MYFVLFLSLFLCSIVFRVLLSLVFYLKINENEKYNSNLFYVF